MCVNIHLEVRLFWGMGCGRQWVGNLGVLNRFRTLDETGRRAISRGVPLSGCGTRLWVCAFADTFQYMLVNLCAYYLRNTSQQCQCYPMHIILIIFISCMVTCLFIDINHKQARCVKTQVLKRSLDIRFLTTFYGTCSVHLNMRRRRYRDYNVFAYRNPGMYNVISD